MPTEHSDPLSQPWLEAAEDLGIEVTAPAAIGGEGYVALVHQFGSPKGTAVVAARSEREAHARTVANADGYYVSAINRETYDSYERDLFTGTLNDWGWYGWGDPPDWYTGTPWGD